MPEPVHTQPNAMPAPDDSSRCTDADVAGAPTKSSAFIRRVVIRNYKNIAACDVKLGELMFLVGPNGSGKSNFLDALRFVSDALRTSLDHALRARGTLKEVSRRSAQKRGRSSGRPTDFAVELEFVLPSSDFGRYSFRIGATSNGAHEVKEEQCEVIAKSSQSHPSTRNHFHVSSGRVVACSYNPAPAAVADRLFLVAASGIDAFRPLYEGLSRIGVYNLDPRRIAAMQQPDSGEILRRDGSNAASMLRRLPSSARQRINDYLSRIVPGVSSVDPKTFGGKDAIEFRQSVAGQEHDWRFDAEAMSDGTLRALGVLLAVFQASEPSASGPLLIGLEEPEMAVHPAAAIVLLSALREASRGCQILVTSHSPDLLDDSGIPTEALLAVDSIDGLAQIGAIDAAGRQVLHEKLFTPGELLRLNQLAPDESAISDVRYERQLRIFADDEGAE